MFWYRNRGIFIMRKDVSTSMADLGEHNRQRQAPGLSAMETTRNTGVGHRFLHALDDDLKVSVLGQLRDLWTHSSTAIEGNTLTLAETHFVLTEGLTVKGKPVKDHNEVIGHARAIDILYSLLERPLVKEDIFNLHCAVQSGVMGDFMRPLGDWKDEPNGAWGIDDEGKRIFIEYALPADVPLLMNEWISAVNTVDLGVSLDNLVTAYTRLHIGFTSIHPFWDGNGRLARLLSNLPLLKAGYPPLVIQNTHREDYIKALNMYSVQVSRLTKHTGVWPQGASSYSVLIQFCQREYAITQEIVEEAMAVQQSRHATEDRKAP